eukprot:GHVR01096463.1.p1 GENE.GHVR01096463.1~~GHVR01096463.1.p1  ORF type:complete len:117 (+),score=9.21 GHVR01096463.1:182-532(+)
MGLVGMPPIGPSRRLIGPGFFRWFRCAILLHVHSRVGSSLNAALSGRPPPLWPLLGDLVVHRQGKASGGWVARQGELPMRYCVYCGLLHSGACHVLENAPGSLPELYVVHSVGFVI